MNAEDCVPMMVSMVRTAVFIMPCPAGCVHTTDVVVTQTEEEHSVLPKDAVGLLLNVAKFRPSIVTSPPAAVGPFSLRWKLMIGASYVKISERVPMRVCRSTAT